MAETQREPVPRVDSGELDTALAFLSFARHCVLKKAGGLSEEQLRRVLVDSGTSVLGLVQHLAEAGGSGRPRGLAGNGPCFTERARAQAAKRGQTYPAAH
jgi:hypothetical protein